MPKRVVGILAIAVLAALTGAAGSPQRGHDTSKSVPPPSQQPSSQPTPVTATNAKFTTISRDVCAKHPNLKQCS